MTLLNTVTNLGGNWPALLALYFVDPLTWKSCLGGENNIENKCENISKKEVSTTKIC